VSSWETVALALYAGIIAVFLYLALGYPLVIAWVARRRRFTPAAVRGHRPSVTLLVSACTEAADVGIRIANFLTLDYPADRLEVIVAVDGADAATEAVVHGWAAHDPRIRCVVTIDRRGKNACLNEAFSLARGEVLVFSDANTRFQRDSLAHLVEPLADPRVGLTCGRLVLVDRTTAVSAGEGTYWGYEDWIKRREGSAGQLLVANGAIFAIRREDFTRLDPRIANDFSTPMDIGVRGLRCLYVPEAVALERETPRARDEFARKVRIVTRGLAGSNEYLGRVSGLRRFELVSHKLLRWFTGWMFLELLALGWWLRDFEACRILLWCQCALVVLGVAGLALARLRLLSAPGYVLMALAASVTATGRFLLGHRATSWAVSARPRLAGDGG
jgi:cellulose synthase/poly-beta-1,6-N-acetylglucosamine synthase-like glycosyltransferase